MRKTTTESQEEVFYLEWSVYPNDTTNLITFISWILWWTVYHLQHTDIDSNSIVAVWVDVVVVVV